jgi:hypothetical protein
VKNKTTTICVGEHYEKNISTGAITKYHYFGGKRIAMRVGTTLIHHFVQDMRICTAIILRPRSGQASARHLW